MHAALRACSLERSLLITVVSLETRLISGEPSVAKGEILGRHAAASGMISPPTQLTLFHVVWKLGHNLTFVRGDRTNFLA